MDVFRREAELQLKSLERQVARREIYWGIHFDQSRIHSPIHKLPTKMTRISRRQFIKGSLALGAGLVLGDMFWFEKYVIDWNYFDRSKDGRHKVKFIQLSDLHLSQVRSYHKSIARKINEKQPDLLFITGDAIEEQAKMEVLDAFMQLIDPAIPKYAILGNWEYWGKVDLDQLRALYRRYNCELLINTHRITELKGRQIAIIGIDDYVGGNADFPAAIQGLPSADTHIVLSHCPAHRDLIAQQQGALPIDLVLSGHTHGGQITFLGLAPFKPQGSGDYLKGWYENAGPPLYVSKGIGTSVLPIRFGARAEMVEMDI